MVHVVQGNLILSFSQSLLYEVAYNHDQLYNCENRHQLLVPSVYVNKVVNAYGFRSYILLNEKPFYC